MTERWSDRVRKRRSEGVMKSVMNRGDEESRKKFNINN